MRTSAAYTPSFIHLARRREGRNERATYLHPSHPPHLHRYPASDPRGQNLKGYEETRGSVSIYGHYQSCSRSKRKRIRISKEAVEGNHRTEHHANGQDDVVERITENRKRVANARKWGRNLRRRPNPMTYAKRRVAHIGRKGNHPSSHPSQATSSPG